MKNSNNLQSNQSVASSPHEIKLENRNNLYISGCIEVVSATTSEVIVKSSLGSIAISGSGLKIKNLNESSCELFLTGEVASIKYGETKKKLLGKIFK